MIFSPGDIVRFYNPQAGKDKYHLCVIAHTDDNAAGFLFINSKPGWEGDFVVKDGEISGLPESPTGQSVVSCSQIIRMTEKRLQIFKAEKVSDFSPALARKLATHIKETPTLTDKEKKAVQAGLSKIT